MLISIRKAARHAAKLLNPLPEIGFGSAAGLLSFTLGAEMIADPGFIPHVGAAAIIWVIYSQGHPSAAIAAGFLYLGGWAAFWWYDQHLAENDEKAGKQKEKIRIQSLRNANADMIGESAITRSRLSPSGDVFIGEQIFQAKASSGLIDSKVAVVVCGVQNGVLIVEVDNDQK